MAKSDILYRFIEVDKSKIDRAKRLVPFSFSSEFPALQRNSDPSDITRSAGLKPGEVYIEILDHNPDNVDLSVLKNRGAFLDEHDEKDQLGVIENAELDPAEKIARGVASLDTHDKAETRLSQMERGSRPHISAGYKYTRFVGEETLANGRKAKRFAWRALEVSSVAIPADPTIGVARNLKDLPAIPVDSAPSIDVEQIAKNLTPQQREQMKRSLLLDPNPAAGGGGAPVDETKIRSAGIESERTRSEEIHATADALIKDHGTKDDGKMADQIRSMVREALKKGESSGDFKMRCMTEVLKAKPAKQMRMVDLGFDEQEIKSYSLVRAVQNCLKRNATVPDPETLEGEAHVRMSKLDLGFSTNGFLVPSDANIHPRSLSRSERRRMQRDLQVNVFGQGGASVATELIMPIIEILRNEMVTDRLGIRTMAGLQGNIAIPRQTAAATAYSVPEIGQLTLSTQALDQIALVPRRVGAVNRYSKQLLIQSSMDVENFVRDDLLKVIALDWDRLVLNGQGAGSEPTGIINTPGISSILFGAAATFAKLVSMETAIAVLNAPRTNRAYVTTSAAKGILKSAAKLLTGATTVAAVALWENDMINGYPAVDSQQVPNNQMIFGSWSDVILGLWGGYDVVIDPYTLADKAEVQITMNTWGDLAVRHPQSFCVSADSAAQ